MLALHVAARFLPGLAALVIHVGALVRRALQILLVVMLMLAVCAHRCALLKVLLDPIVGPTV
ncbi:hypothetical protein AWV79_31820 [Cupriavidus sp. UYMMa02A]|nr:hypothetical protein AWV79_31820 [Cupriavidus sp. UYMMa02A]